MNRVVYMGGKWVPETEAKVSIYDLSVSQGAAAFEMTRSFNGVTFKLIEHLERLVKSCKDLDIPLPYAVGELALICEEACQRNDHGPGEEHRLMIVASPGCPQMYRHLEGTTYGPWIYIADFPLRYTVEGMGHYFEDGVNLVSSWVHQIPDSAIPARAKHRSRLHFHRAQVQAAPDWALLRDSSGYVTEGPGFNIAFTLDDHLFLCSHAALQGISLESVGEVADSLGYDVHPHWITNVEDLKHADEVFVTGTPFCLLPVGAIDGQLIHGGKPGPAFKQIISKWGELVGVDIAGQIQTWDALTVAL